MMEGDIRWKQRLESFEKAFEKFEEGIEHFQNEPEDIIKEAVIQRFEFTHELAWKTMREYLKADGIIDIMGSKSTTRAAFNNGLITDGETWMKMIESRNRTVHTYDERILTDEFENITENYYPLIKLFLYKMQSLK